MRRELGGSGRRERGSGGGSGRRGPGSGGGSAAAEPPRSGASDPEDLAAARTVLRRHWGHPDFRPAQAPVVRAVLEGRDVLAVLPTGGGKSVCFQVPALLSDRLTLCVSPLISLMGDQVDAARRRRIPAAALTSVTPAAQRAATEAAAREGRLRLLYASPERLASAAFRRLLAGCDVARLAVDEAHCISEWGHDFRPSYRRIAEVRPLIGDPPLVALTATATPRTRADIEASLGLRTPVRVVRPVDRSNLRWSAVRARSLEAGARRALEAVRRERGAAILYVATRRRAVRAAAALRRLGASAAPYHAGMEGEARKAVQAVFLEGGLRVVCATSAFGMGIDHPRVRLVAHLGLPGSLEAYVQEAGRAGRDGLASRCLLIGCPGDTALQRGFVRRAWPAPRTLARVWDAAPPGRAVDAVALRRRGVGAEAEEIEAAFRMMVEVGAARAVMEPGRTEGGVAIVRGPAALRRRLDFGASRRGRRRGLGRLRALEGYLRARDCRRAVIARYFGEPAPPCAGCDRCEESGRKMRRLAGAEGGQAPLRSATPGRPPGAAAAPPGTVASGPAPGRSGRTVRPAGPGRSAASGTG